MAEAASSEFWVGRGSLKWYGVEYRAKLVQPVGISNPPAAGWPLAVYFPSLDPTDGDIDGLASQFGAVAPEPFVLAISRPQAHARWFIDDTSYWGWVQGQFCPGLLNMYCQWLAYLSGRPGIDGARVGLFGYAAGAYATAEVFAHATVKLCGVGLASVHGHGQPDLDGLRMMHACGCPMEKFAAFLGRIRGHGGAGWIEVTHAERDAYARILDARQIISAIDGQQESLALPRVILRLVEPGDEDKRRKTSSSYFDFAFVRSEFFTGLLGGFARRLHMDVYAAPVLERVPPAKDVTDMLDKLSLNSREEASRTIKILDPLRRRWHSSCFGEVRPAISEADAVDDCPRVRLHMECSGPILSCSIFVQGHGVYLVGGAEQLRLSPGESHCLSGPVVWRSEFGKVKEVWSAALADAADDALLALPGNLQLPETFTRPRDFSSQFGTGQLTVGFCVTLKNRFWQLKHSLPLTLTNLWPHRQWTRVYLVDFGSSDGALEFVKSACRVALEDGLLHLYHAELEFFHASVAKNTAHMIATEDVLVNLDCDNILGVDSAPEVRRHFEAGAKALHFSGTRGTCGRIACLREDFLRVGGYDEEAHPFGAQDIDFLARLQLLHGKSSVQHLAGAFAIANTKKATIKEVNPHLGINWAQMDAENRQVFKQRRADQGPVRNSGRKPGLAAERWMVDEVAG